MITEGEEERKRKRGRRKEERGRMRGGVFIEDRPNIDVTLIPY